MVTLNMHHREKMSRINTRIALQQQQHQPRTIHGNKQCVCVTLNLSLMRERCCGYWRWLNVCTRHHFFWKLHTYTHSRTQWLRVDLDTQLNVKCTTPKKRIEKKWRMSERKTKKELRKREILNALMRCSPLAHEQQALMFKLVSSAQNTRSDWTEKNRYQMRKNGLESAYNSKCNTNQQYSAM